MPPTALHESLELARHVEALGYRRFWLAEHHNMPGIASAATAVAIGHVAAGTKTIRVGAGGIMLPNHAPLVIAEQFGTLASLVSRPHRSGPGPRARHRSAHRAGAAPDHAGRRRYLSAGRSGAAGLLRAQPAGPGGARHSRRRHQVPVWILGSSHYGAQLAAALGLPYAFASHFAPADLEYAHPALPPAVSPLAVSATSLM